MPITPARKLAHDVLMAVEEEGGYASDLLHSGRAAGMRADDRRLATEIVMGVLRRRGEIDYAIAQAARRPMEKIAAPARTALRIGAYQLRHLSRVPASAAVHESVEMAKADAPKLSGFVNAVLRHLSLEPVAAMLAGEEDLGRRREAEYSHPAWLLERWSASYGVEAAGAIGEYNNRTPPVAIALEHGATAPEEVDTPHLTWVAPVGRSESWLRSPAANARSARGVSKLPRLELAPGRLLTGARRVVRGDVTRTGAYLTGKLRIQDEASQLIPHLLEAGNEDRILDACAAPGSKTLGLRALAPGAQLTALELHERRAQVLRQRLGAGAGANIVVADAARPLPVSATFTRILVDAPCTGTGTLARNPEIRWRLKPEDPARLAHLQFAIARRCAQALAPGGRLVYSVCSIEPEEGEAVVERVLGAEAGLRRVPMGRILARLSEMGAVVDGATTHHDALRILPGELDSDGFYAVALERLT